MRRSPEGAVAFRRAQDPWQTAATGLFEAAKAAIRDRLGLEFVRSNIAVNIVSIYPFRLFERRYIVVLSWVLGETYVHVHQHRK